MAAIQYIPIGASEFTKELLDSNFAAIAQVTQLTDKTIGEVQGVVTDLSKVVFDMSKQLVQISSKVSKPRNSKLLLLGVAAGAAYIGYKYCEAEFEERVKAPRDLADKAAANVKTFTEEVKDSANGIKKDLPDI